MNKKGFTLIELLAVIVILAIIAVIAVPTILGVIEKSKKGAAKSSALGYIDAVEKQIAINMLDSDEANDIKDGKYTVSELTSKGVNVKGKKPSNDSLVEIEKNKVTDYILTIENYKVEYDKENKKMKITKIGSKKDIEADSITISGETEVRKGETITLTVTFEPSDTTDKSITWESSKPEVATIENGIVTGINIGTTTITARTSNNKEATYEVKVPSGATIDLNKQYSSANVEQKGLIGVAYLDPSDLEKECNSSNSVSTTGTKTGCMKWYIYDDSGDNYTMILDHNTTATVQYNSSNVNTSMVQAKTALENDTSTWKEKARLITADEIAKITGNTSFKGATTSTDGWFYFDSNSQNQTATSQGASKYAWLYDYTYSCTSYGCNKVDSNSNIYGYWTSTPIYGSGSIVWYVNRYGGLSLIDASNTISGVRPVITISKSIVS